MKRPLIVWLSLICIFTISFIVYLALNIGLTIVVGIPLSYLGFATGLHVLSMLWCLVIMGNKSRRIETRIRWTVYICFVPFFGIVSYILFGRPYKFKKNQAYQFKDNNQAVSNLDLNLQIIDQMTAITPEFKRAFLPALKLQNAPVFQTFKIQYFSNGNDYFVDLLSQLAKAQDYVLLNVYMLQEGELLDQLSQVLISKAQQGVKICVIYDFLGSYSRFIHTKKKWKQAGMQVVGFSPVHFPFIGWNANYRNHRKDIIIDGHIGYVGGMNISDEYCNLSTKFGIWNDSAYKMIGESVRQLEAIFMRDWEFYHKHQKHQLSLNQTKVSHITSKQQFLQVVSSGPNHPTPIHLDILLSLMNSAQKSIWIKTPYFIPPPELIDALCQAANSGLDVRLILPGKTDKFLILDVSKNRTRKLFENGVKIYSVHNTFVHEKSYVIDDHICFVGTTNLDYRALFSDQQTMLLVNSVALNAELKTKMRADFAAAHLYTTSPIKEVHWIKRIFVKMYNIIAPVL